MGEPDLKLVDASEMDRCGAETVDGTPCENPAGENGRCHLPGHQDGPVGGPEPPEHLGEAGRGEWKRRMDRLVRAGAVEEVDLGILEQACEMYEARRMCHNAVREHGAVVQGRKGVKKNPAAAKFKSYGTEYRMCIKQLLRMRESVSDAASGGSSEDDPWTAFS